MRASVCPLLLAINGRELGLIRCLLHDISMGCLRVIPIVFQHWLVLQMDMHFIASVEEVLDSLPIFPFVYYRHLVLRFQFLRTPGFRDHRW